MLDEADSTHVCRCSNKKFVKACANSTLAMCALRGPWAESLGGGGICARARGPKRTRNLAYEKSCFESSPIFSPQIIQDGYAIAKIQYFDASC